MRRDREEEQIGEDEDSPAMVELSWLQGKNVIKAKRIQMTSKNPDNVIKGLHMNSIQEGVWENSHNLKQLKWTVYKEETSRSSEHLARFAKRILMGDGQIKNK